MDESGFLSKMVEQTGKVESEHLLEVAKSSYKELQGHSKDEGHSEASLVDKSSSAESNHKLNSTSLTDGGVRNQDSSLISHETGYSSAVSDPLSPDDVKSPLLSHVEPHDISPNHSHAISPTAHFVSNSDACIEDVKVKLKTDDSDNEDEDENEETSCLIKNEESVHVTKDEPEVDAAVCSQEQTEDMDMEKSIEKSGSSSNICDDINVGSPNSTSGKLEVDV